MYIYIYIYRSKSRTGDPSAPCSRKKFCIYSDGTHAHIDTQIHTYVYTNTCACMHKHTHTHARIHACRHTHTYTHTGHAQICRKKRRRIQCARVRAEIRLFVPSVVQSLIGSWVINQCLNGRAKERTNKRMIDCQSVIQSVSD